MADILVNIRKDCPMRHENGNCLPVGGFCTSVNDEICKGLKSVYEHGKHDGVGQYLREREEDEEWEWE